MTQRQTLGIRGHTRRKLRLLQEEEKQPLLLQGGLVTRPRWNALTKSGNLAFTQVTHK